MRNLLVELNTKAPSAQGAASDRSDRLRQTLGWSGAGLPACGKTGHPCPVLRVTFTENKGLVLFARDIFVPFSVSSEKDLWEAQASLTSIMARGGTGTKGAKRWRVAVIG